MIPTKTIFTWIATVALFVMLSLGTALAADAKKGNKLTGADESFVKEAASAGMMEVQLGKIAADNASNDKVKDFGKRMQEDHGKANDELKSVASNKGVTLPKELSGKHKRTFDRLSKFSGAEFDREYMKAMVDDHQEDLTKFKKQADKGNDPDVKQFASKNVSVLEQHLSLAKQTEQEVRGSGKGTEKRSDKGTDKASSGMKSGTR
jgi:putative membrane protein